MTNRVTRRRVLGGVAAASVAAGLAACSGGPGTTESGGGGANPAEGGGFVPPAYEPMGGIEPELPGTAEGVPPAFLSYPDPPIQRDGFPLPETALATALLQGNQPPLIPPDQNPAYEVFRTQAGNRMEATTIISTEYRQKFQVTIAGGEMPDFVQMKLVPRYLELLEANFTDLSEVLGGEKVKDYPALAGIPTDAWKVTTHGGRLWGVPRASPPSGRVMITRGDILEAKGIDPSPELTSGQDFLDLLNELAEPEKNLFAMGGDPVNWLMRALQQMMGAPNQWGVNDDGTFYHTNTTEEMKEALNEGAKIIKAGYMHPNSFSHPGQNHAWWVGGVTPLLINGISMWGKYGRERPDYKGNAAYADFVAIRQQDSPDRLAELLRLTDFIASPFGTQQFLDVNYGALDHTYEMVDGNPQYLEDGPENVVVGWPYAGSRLQSVLFTPGQDDLVRAQHNYLSDVIPAGVDNASAGLYSETALTGNGLGRKLTDVQRGILLGEKPMSEWDDFVTEWRAEGGDKIAEEYAEAAAQS